MLDIATRQRLCVLRAGKSRAYIPLPEAQLEKVAALLHANGVAHEVDEYAISLDGGPEETVVYLDRHVDTATVQRLLDDTP